MNQIEIIRKYLFSFPQTSSFIKTINEVLVLDEHDFHLTASGFVFKNDSILLIKHRYLKVWLQPGGHIDSGETPNVAAQREVLEETGWVTKYLGDGVPFDIDVHLIPDNPIKSEKSHWHIDCGYVLHPVEYVDASDPEETKWFDLKDVENSRIQRVIQKLNR
jgi:8-oxo-dGTP pyrophosphatase MutT (NUDIX family)